MLAGPFLLALVAFIGWALHWSGRSDLALRYPGLGKLLTGLVAFSLLSAISQSVALAIGLGNLGIPRAWWPILSLGLLAPLGEELFFRGVLFRALAGRIASGLVMLISAAAASLLYIQLSGTALALIFADELFFAGARSWSKSTLLPLLLHVAGNLYLIAQTLPA